MFWNQWEGSTGTMNVLHSTKDLKWMVIHKSFLFQEKQHFTSDFGILYKDPPNFIFTLLLWIPTSCEASLKKNQILYLGMMHSLFQAVWVMSSLRRCIILDKHWAVLYSEHWI